MGQVTPALRALSEDRQLWRRLCQHHFTEQQVRALPWGSGVFMSRRIFKELGIIKCKSHIQLCACSL